MVGTLVNAGAIAGGGIIGLFLKKGVNKDYEESMNKALGIAVVVIGLNGIITSMISADGGGVLSSGGELMLVLSLVIGTFLGELCKIDQRLNSLSKTVEEKFKLSGFAHSFVNGTLIYCVGAMAIIGSLNDGLYGDPSVLFIKSILDGVSAIVLSATLGGGVIFASIPILIYQGAITLGASFLYPILAGELLTEICMVGYCLVVCIGLNFLSIPRIKTANMLPAIAIPPLWYLAVYLYGLI
ncbi:MAG: DUF554 domain-containing protein [Bacillota bacterium]